MVRGELHMADKTHDISLGPVSDQASSPVRVSHFRYRSAALKLAHRGEPIYGPEGQYWYQAIYPKSPDHAFETKLYLSGPTCHTISKAIDPTMSADTS